MPSTLLKPRLHRKRRRRHRHHRRRLTHGPRGGGQSTRQDELIVQPPAQPPKPKPKPKPPPKLPPPPDTTHRNAERLLWRAGFGPRPGDVDAVVSKGLDATIKSLIYPSGSANLIGPEPR